MKKQAPYGNYEILQDLYDVLLKNRSLSHDRFAKISNFDFKVEIDDIERFIDANYRSKYQSQISRGLSDDQFAWEAFYLNIYLLEKQPENQDTEKEPLKLGFDKTSWRQFCKKFQIQTSLLKKIVKEDNIKLAIDIINHCLQTAKGGTLLLRYMGQNNYGYRLTAIREEFYNRLDNIYLVKQLIDNYEEIVGSLDIHYISHEEGSLVIEFKDKTVRGIQLKDRHEKFLTGIKLHNSDTGTILFKLTLIYIRLPGENGMTAPYETEVRDKRIKSLLTTRYPDSIPPLNLPKDLYENLRFAMINVFNQSKSCHEDQYIKQSLKLPTLKISENINKLNEVALIVEDPASENYETGVKKYINAVLVQSGMRVLRGISVQSIFQCYLFEREQIGEDNAYALYNAITRYASHNLRCTSDIDAHNALQRQGQGEPLSPDEAYELSEKISQTARRVIDLSYDWGKTHKRAVKRIVDDLPKI